MRTHAFSRKRALAAYCVSMGGRATSVERRGLERDELYVNLGCLRKCAQVAGI
jgi:hypothetical protein